MKAGAWGLGCAAALWLCSSGAGQDLSEENGFHIEEVPTSVLKEFQAHIEAESWRDLFRAYRARLRSYANRLVRPPEAPSELLSFREYAIRLFSRLPEKALAEYRIQFNGELNRAVEVSETTGDPAPLEAAVETWFFAEQADVQMDRLANRYLEQGEWLRAARHWRRLLRYYPDPRVDLGVVAGRLIYCGQLLESRELIEEARKLARRRGIEGVIRVGSRRIDLERFSREARPFPPARSSSADDRDLPDMDPAGGLDLDRVHPTLELSLGRLEGVWGGPGKGKSGLVPFSIPMAFQAGGRPFLVYHDGVRLYVVNPERMKAGRADRAIYWMDEVRSPQCDPARGVRLPAPVKITMPYAGAILDGDLLYVNMHSPESRPVQSNPRFGRVPYFPPLNSIRVYRLLDSHGRVMPRRLIATTDPAMFHGRSTRDFRDRRFHFSWPMHIRGNDLYVGLVAEAGNDQESYVACFDKRTLEVRWITFICSAAVRNPFWGRTPWDVRVFPTLIEAYQGVIYVLTNLGCVAAVDPVTGSLLWLSSYDRDPIVPNPRDPRRRAVRSLERPPNRILIHRNRLYVLAMDSARLHVFDALDGRPLKGFDLPKQRGRDYVSQMNWEDMHHLVGVVNGALVLTGAKGLVMRRLEDGLMYVSRWSNGNVADGRPFIHQGKIYVPVSAGGRLPARPLGGFAGLRVYDAKTWKLIHRSLWKEDGQWGNVLVFGDRLAIAGVDRLGLWTSVEAGLAAWDRMARQSPARPELLYEYGMKLLEVADNRRPLRRDPKAIERLERARKVFSKFLWLVEGRPEWREQVRACRRKLYDVFLHLGDHRFRREGGAGQAAAFYLRAREFAYDEQTYSDAALRLGLVYEKQGKFREAGETYLEVIRKAGDAVVESPDGSGSESSRRFALRRINRIVTQYGESALDHLDKLARKIIRGAGEGVEEKIRLVERLPLTRSVRRLVEDIGAALDRIRDPLRRAEILRRLRGRFPDFYTLERARQLIDSLEKLKDFERLKKELLRLKKLWGEESSFDPRYRTVAAWVDARLKQIARTGGRRSTLIGERIVEIGNLGASDFRPGPLRIPLWRGPLKPGGVLPPGFGPDLELIRYGNRVELWDLAKGKKVWSRGPPGVYFGAEVESADGDRCRIKAVAAGSPAATAGLKPGDVIAAVDGAEVSVKGFMSLLRAAEPGRIWELTLQGGRRVPVRLSTYPAHAEVPIVAAGFSRDYSLVVVWPEWIVALDLKDGAVRWTYGGGREGARFSAAGWLDGRVVILEELGREDQNAATHRSPSHPGFRRLPFEDGPGGDAFRGGTGGTSGERRYRILVLADTSGQLVYTRWIRQAGPDGALTAAEFRGSPLGDRIAMFLCFERTIRIGHVDRERGLTDIETIDIAKEGLFDWAFVEEDERVLLAYPDGRKRLIVRSVQLGGKETWTTTLTERSIPSLPKSEQVRLFTDGRYVCVAISAQDVSHIAVLEAATGRFAGSAGVVSPKRGRVTYRVLAGALDEDTLIVYGVGKSKGAGFLFAYGIGNAAISLKWRSLAPWQEAKFPVEMDLTRDLVILRQSRAYSMDMENGRYRPALTVYSRKRDGKRVFDPAGFEKADTTYLPAFWRGRLYLVEGEQGCSVVYGTPKGDGKTDPPRSPERQGGGYSPSPAPGGNECKWTREEWNEAIDGLKFYSAAGYGSGFYEFVHPSARAAWEKVRRLGREAYPYLIAYIADPDLRRGRGAIVALKSLCGDPRKGRKAEALKPGARTAFQEEWKRILKVKDEDVRRAMDYLGIR